MNRIGVSEAFSVELSGDVHSPHWTFELELCALLFREDELKPFTFTGTHCPTAIAGVTAERRQGKYAAIGIEPKDIDLAYTRLIIAAHSEEVTPETSRRNGRVTINPTLRSLTYSTRGALNFGCTARFLDEDAVLGAELLTLTRADAQVWHLDDEQQPASYPLLAQLLKKFGVELAPYEV